MDDSANSCCGTVAAIEQAQLDYKDGEDNANPVVGDGLAVWDGFMVLEGIAAMCRNRRLQCSTIASKQCTAITRALGIK